MMSVTLLFALLLTAIGAYSVPTTPVMTECPNGFRYVNGDTGNVMYDDRDIKTCMMESAMSCIMIKYTYKTSEALVSAAWGIPCQPPKVLASFDLNNLYPKEAEQLDLNIQTCSGPDCVDFTPQESIDTFCNRGVVVKDLDSDVILVDDVIVTQCKQHQDGYGCFTMKQYFVQDGKSAVRIMGDCYDEWRSYNFIWDKFYPYIEDSFTAGGYCEQHNCIAFKVWHKDNFDTRTCYCTDDNKPPGIYNKPIIETCKEDMCNIIADH